MWVGKIFLGLPIGFNRLGFYKEMRPKIFKDTTEFEYNMFNVPIWKAKVKDHKVFVVRGLTPRLNDPFIHVFLNEDEFDKVECKDVTEDIKEMD